MSTYGEQIPVRGLLAVLIAMSGSPLLAEKFPPKAVETFLSQHCYDCHDDTKAEAKLNLLDLEFDLENGHNFETWARVFDRVESGEMPPEKKPRPEKEPKTAFLETLKEPLYSADRKDRLEKGRVKVRRLTRREYEHTIHDLIGVDLPLQELLPEDPATHGFETVSEGQQLSHYNLGSFLEVADVVLNDAFDRVRDKDESFSKTFSPEMLSKKGGGNYRGAEARGGFSISWPMRLQFYGRVPVTTVPDSGWYEVTLKDVHAINPKNPAVWGTLRSGACSSNTPILYPVGLVEATKEKRDLTYVAWIREGHMLELKPNDVTLKVAPSGATGGNVSYKGRDLTKQGFSGIAVSAISLKRVYPHASREELRKNLYPGVKNGEFTSAKTKEEKKALLKRTITKFADRAFRRPVTDEQVAPYVELALQVYEEPGREIGEALRGAYRAILCSPRFLTFVETSGKLDDHALASRLSYTLWNSMPDEKLREHADKGELQDSKIFHAEITRLIDDRKSDRFIEGFTDQWLNLKEIDFTAPDAKLYRTFDPVVQDSMLLETRSFLKTMIRENRPISELIDADYGLLNERLARFYSMKNLSLKAGGGVQKVSLGENKRGGLVTQGSVLKVTANGTTTSPVVRGVWVGERILGLEIHPPPPDIPAVEPDIRGAVSIRDQLDKHRNNESCASCHRKIDPAGFALESFDPVGLWRTAYGSKKNAAKVDPSGVTPEGEEFANVSQWKEIYLKKPDLLTESFVKQLLTYATGAAPRFSDRDAIADIVSKNKEKNYGLRSIVHTSLASEVFKSK